MSRPIEKQSVSGQSSTGAGEAFSMKGHDSVGLALDTANVDTANDTLTVRLEAKVGGTWMAVKDAAGNAVEITESDVVDGSLLVFAPGFAATEVRANVTSFSDASGSDLSVDAWVLGTGNAGGEGHSAET